MKKESRKEPKSAIIRNRVKAWMVLHDMSSERMAVKMRMSKRTWQRRMQEPETLSVMEVEKIEKITGLDLIQSIQEPVKGVQVI